MTERPIPFSDAMVLAILDGRKTQTRRVAKLTDSGRVKAPGSPRNWHLGDQDAVLACPHGQPGDRLWVREAWRIHTWNQETGEVRIEYRADGHVGGWVRVPDNDVFLRLWQQSCDDAYAAGVKPDGDYFGWDEGKSPCRWRPPMFMFHWASRIALEITGVRVERLQDISEEDAKAEGIVNHRLARNSYAVPGMSDGHYLATAREAFEALWSSINGAESWAANPWVWVVEFRRLP